MISPQLEKTIQQAIHSAQEHEYVTIEHLLLALLDNESAKSILNTFSINFKKLKNALHDHIQENVPQIAGEPSNPLPTLGFQRTIQRALRSLTNKQEPADGIDGQDILVAIFSEEDCAARFFLENVGMTRFKLLQWISHGILPESAHQQEDSSKESHGEPDEENVPMDPKTSALEKYTISYGDLAKNGKIDPVIGRDTEIERVIQILCRRQKNNPILVGEAGVGKTAIAQGLARRIHENHVPSVLKDAQVYGLDIGSLLAGTKFRGELEERLKQVFQEINALSQAILFIDEIHMMIGAGATADSHVDISNLLKPLLSSGHLRCMGASTYDEYRRIFEKDRALARRFQKVDVNEPSIQDTIHILKGLKSAFEDHHQVKYTDEAIQTAVELSARYIHDRFLPDKAIDVIDEAGAAQRILPEKDRHTTITASDIEIIISKIARIPQQTVSHDDLSKLAALEDDLKQTVFGQNKAIEAVVDAIKMSRSGLGKTDKPIGSFLFSGPTGVGKTEIAKQLAKLWGVELIRFDMSEYMEKHAVSRLIGAPPGFVGFEQAGLLTEAVNKHPYAVILLDEIEKAHPDIFNILLQVMDDGRLTDNHGRVANFHHIVLIMTTNAGAQLLNTKPMGFQSHYQVGDEMVEIKRLFSPEFRNRLDAIVPFAPLSFEVILQVVDKFLLALKEQLLQKKVSANFSDALRQYLAKKGFDPLMGARPMQRLIQERIRKALADELLFGKLSDGGQVDIDVDQESEVILHFDLTKKRQRKRNKTNHEEAKNDD